MNDLSIRCASLLWVGSVVALLPFLSPLAAASGPKTAEACECSVLKPVLPVSLTASRSNQGWTLSFNVPPYSGFTDVFVRFDEQPEASTGHETSLDVMTGKPEARTWMVLPEDWVTPDEHTVDGAHGAPRRHSGRPAQAALLSGG